MIEEPLQKIFISQRDNFNANFGDVIRSSAIFYYQYGADFQTTITFMNYWLVKRGITVTILASLRDMSGQLISRERLSFYGRSVINYKPKAVSQEVFEGSLEIEVFSIADMVIPYSAIMATYETARGITMVHSYARTYSRHEVEEGRCISDGEEACWTLRDDSSCRSFAYFHNGGANVGPQNLQLSVQNHRGEQKKSAIRLDRLMPYQTVKIAPSKYIDDLPEFLDGQPGSAQLSFKLGESFTRMLVGHETPGSNDFQVTHSNFNYSVHQTDELEDEQARAYMYVPSIGSLPKYIVVYPDSSEGKYLMSYQAKEHHFATGERLSFFCKKGLLVFSRKDGPLPTRLVTGITAQKQTDVLPFECSLNVLTTLQPPKKFWWGLVAWNQSLKSQIIIHPLEPVYGLPGKLDSILLKLYSSASTDVIQKELSTSSLNALDDGMNLNEIFPDAEKFLAGDFGYFTMFSDYPGFTCYSTLEKCTGSMCLEHAF